MGKSKQKSTSEQTPFAPAVGGIESIIGQANQNLNRDRALAPTDPSTLQAADLLQQLAQGGDPGSSAGALSFANQLFGQAPVGPETLAQFAGGDFVGQNDQLLQQTISNQQLDTSDLIRRIAAGAGRSGSPAETGVLARELGKIGLDARLGQRNIDQNQRLSAAQTLGQQGISTIGNIGNLQGAELFSPALLQQAGGIRQGAEQTELDNVLEIIRQQQGVLFPAGQLGGTSVGTQVNQANPVTQGINLLQTIGGLRQPVSR